MPPIDLDANAGQPLHPAAWEAMAPVLRDGAGNPASPHALGRRARRLLDDARERVAALLGAAPEEVVFTSGATEANNLALFGLAATRPLGVLLTSDLEHPCVREPGKQLAGRGWALRPWPVTPRGVVTIPDDVEGVTLAALMLANHETGAVQPVREAVARLGGTPLHCDAAQAVGKLTVDFAALGCATLSLSAHKFGGPVGAGALLVRRDANLAPVLLGGPQQRGRRPGTESVALAVGLATSLAECARTMDADRRHAAELRRRLWERLAADAAPAVLNGPEVGATDVVPSTLNVSFPGVRSDVLLMRLDLAGVACSAGAACSSGSMLPSPALRAMGLADGVVRSAVRFSFGRGRTAAEVDEAARRIVEAVRGVRG